MTTTSVSDPAGPLTEKRLRGLGPVTSPQHLASQSSPSSVTWGAGSRPHAMSAPVLSEGFMTNKVSIPPLIPVALTSRLWGVSELLHRQLCCPWAPNLCKGLCSGKGACQPLSPHSAPWVKHQTVGHPWRWAWSVERGIWSAAGPVLWPLRGPDHTRWGSRQQWVLLAGEKHPCFPVLWPLITSVWWGVLHVYMRGCRWW